MSTTSQFVYLNILFQSVKYLWFYVGFLRKNEWEIWCQISRNKSIFDCGILCEINFSISILIIWMFLWNAIARTKNLIFIFSKNRTVWLFWVGWWHAFCRNCISYCYQTIMIIRNVPLTKCLIDKIFHPFCSAIKSNNSLHFIQRQ